MSVSLIAEYADSCRIRSGFTDRDEAVRFGRKCWQKMKDRGVRSVRVFDTLEETPTALWVSAQYRVNSIPEGRYAFHGRRYFVARPKSAKWKGWTFLKTGSVYHDPKTLAMADPSGRIVKFHPALIAISEEPKKRASEYGRITGLCCICGRPLENPESRKLGIGPVCATKFNI